MDPDDREFMRELLLRHEKATNSMIKRLDTNTEALRTHTREFVAQMRTERQAFLRRLERFGGQGA
jgi:hypothetical protein